MKGLLFVRITAKSLLSSCFRGKIISHPKEQNWRVQFHNDVSHNLKKYHSDVIRVTITLYLMKEAEFQYTLEHKAVKWSPLVSNLHMGHIRVVFVAFWLACLID